MLCIGMCTCIVLGSSFYSKRVLSLFCSVSDQHSKISTEAQASWCRHLAVCNATASSKTPSDGYGAAVTPKVSEMADAN